MRRLLVAAAAAVAIVVAGPAPSGAQGAGEAIRNYDVTMTIEPNGELTVHEEIVYDFGSNQRHGIFRDLVRLDVYDTEKDRRYDIDVDRVTMDGSPVEYDTFDQDRYREVKIGDPDRTISGTHEYAIDYTVRGAISPFPEHDELFWDAIGHQWPVLMDRAHVTVRSPAAVNQLACYRGAQGSALPCASSSADGNVATFSDSNLFPGEGVTIVVSIPKGTIDPPPELLFSDIFTIEDVFAVTPQTVGLGGAVALVGFAGLGVLVWRRGRDYRYVGSAVDAAMGNESGDEERIPLGQKDAGTVEFVPPNGIRPGQVGTLLDERANLLDVTATIIDLAVRKHLRIVEVDDDGDADYELQKLEGGQGDLLPYEHRLYGDLFKTGDAVRLSSLKYEFASEISAVRDALHKDVVTHGWYRKRPDRTRQGWVGLGVLLAILGVIGVFVVGFFSSFGIVPLPLIFVGLAMCFFAGRMPARTAKGSAMLSRVRGFRRLFDEGEEDVRQRFAEEQGIFAKYLPYAIVFGCTRKWARAFEGLDAEVLGTDGWYVGTHPFSSVELASAVNHFESSAVGTLYASAPSSSSSSGFSGGGFSGGGGGGGGGGSW